MKLLGLRYISVLPLKVLNKAEILVDLHNVDENICLVEVLINNSRIFFLGTTCGICGRIRLDMVFRD